MSPTYSEPTYSQVVQTARDYYNSPDADNFYFHIWGGEDIHIGLYEGASEAIATASRRTVALMADRLHGIDEDSRILDIGSGYGGAARYLAKRFGCAVTALNLSETENARNRKMNRQEGLDHLVEVVDGSFEAIPGPGGAYDAVWSQDAILHSGKRELVVAEVARVLKPGGTLILTDIMQSDGVDPALLKPVLERIHLTSLGSLKFYRAAAKANGMVEAGFEDKTPQLVQHYSRVGEELEAKRSILAGKVSDGYIDRMLQGLRAWVDAGKAGHLVWGILRFRKAG